MISDRYTLVREIGRGGMGAVWLGRDEVLGRAVAMKRVGAGPGGSTPDLDRAEREARLAARLNHPHVVAVYDLLADGADHWLVMEYVEGETLAEVVRRRGALTPDEAAPFIRQAADALAAAHAAGIVHRDVKPSNILVTADGQVKLSDFGIARARADASLTQTGLVTGSPAYLAPEVASGAQATEASDVWSLGATLFHALSGRPPYDVGENVLGALYKIVHEDPPRLPEAGWLTPVLAATMTHEPADRWTVAQVRDLLVGGPSAPLPAPLPASRRRGDEVATPTPGTPAGDDGTQVLGVPPATSYLAPAPPGPGGSRAARRRSGGGQAVAVVVVLALIAVVGVVAWLVGSGDGDQDRATDRAGGPSTPASSSAAPPKKEVTADGMENFVEDYLSTVTRDPRAAWGELTPEFQDESGGYSSYEGYWGGIKVADLLSAEADTDARTITYRVEYQHQDGSKSTDEVTLRLAGSDGDYHIAGEA